jgi:hypothetical protein
MNDDQTSFPSFASLEEFGGNFLLNREKIFCRKTALVGWLVRLYNFHYALVVKDC